MHQKWIVSNALTLEIKVDLYRKESYTVRFNVCCFQFYFSFISFNWRAVNFCPLPNVKLIKLHKNQLSWRRVIKCLGWGNSLYMSLSSFCSHTTQQKCLISLCIHNTICYINWINSQVNVIWNTN